MTILPPILWNQPFAGNSLFLHKKTLPAAPLFKINRFSAISPHHQQLAMNIVTPSFRTREPSLANRACLKKQKRPVDKIALCVYIHFVKQPMDMTSAENCTC